MEGWIIVEGWISTKQKLSWVCWELTRFNSIGKASPCQGEDQVLSLVLNIFRFVDIKLMGEISTFGAPINFQNKKIAYCSFGSIQRTFYSAKKIPWRRYAERYRNCGMQFFWKFIGAPNVDVSPIISILKCLLCIESIIIFLKFV